MSCLNNYNLDVILNQLNCWCLQWRGKIATVFPSGMTQIEQIQELFTAVKSTIESQVNVIECFKELYSFVHDFLTDERFKEEVTKWLESAYNDGRLLTLIQSAFPEYRQLLSLYKYPNIYIDNESYEGLEGLTGETCLMNYNINDMYSLYDAMLQENVFTKDIIGYGGNSEGEQDSSLPIYKYSYRGLLTENNGIRKPKLVVMTSGLHGNEKIGAYCLYKFVEKGMAQKAGKLVNDFWSKHDFDIIPICNPFGFNNCINSSEEEANNNKGRLNARNVDLNRNFASGWSASTPNSGSAAESEIETRAITNYFKSLDPNNVLAYSDWHASFNDTNYDTTTQVYFQSTSVLNNNVDLINKVVRMTSKQLAEQFDILLNNQYINVSGNLFMPTSGSMIGEFAFVLNKYSNLFIFEGGKRWYDVLTKKFIYNKDKNFIAMSENAFTIMSNITEFIKDDNTGIYNNIKENWVNGDNEIGNSYNDYRKTSYAILSQDIYDLPAFKKFKFYVNKEGYKVRILYLNNDNTINGDSGWQDYVESTPSIDNKCILVVRKQNSQYIAPFMINEVFTPIFEHEENSSSIYTIGLKSNYGTIAYDDIFISGRIAVIQFGITTNKEIPANTKFITNMPNNYRANSSGAFVDLISDNTTSPETYKAYYSGNGTLSNVEVIPNSATIRGTIVYLLE